MTSLDAYRFDTTARLRENLLTPAETGVRPSSSLDVEETTEERQERLRRATYHILLTHSHQGIIRDLTRGVKANLLLQTKIFRIARQMKGDRRFTSDAYSELRSFSVDEPPTPYEELQADGYQLLLEISESQAFQRCFRASLSNKLENRPIAHHELSASDGESSAPVKRKSVHFPDTMDWSNEEQKSIDGFSRRNVRQLETRRKNVEKHIKKWDDDVRREVVYDILRSPKWNSHIQQLVERNEKSDISQKIVTLVRTSFMMPSQHPLPLITELEIFQSDPVPLNLICRAGRKLLLEISHDRALILAFPFLRSYDHDARCKETLEREIGRKKILMERNAYAALLDPEIGRLLQGLLPVSLKGDGVRHKNDVLHKKISEIIFLLADSSRQSTIADGLESIQTKAVPFETISKSSRVRATLLKVAEDRTFQRQVPSATLGPESNSIYASITFDPSFRYAVKKLHLDEVCFLRSIPALPKKTRVT